MNVTADNSVSLNAAALVAICRHNPESPGGSPVSTFGTGFCIASDGLLVTAWHNLERFDRTWSIVDWDAAKSGARVEYRDIERHEMPFGLFLCPVDKPDELTVFPVLSRTGNTILDVAVAELGGRGKFRPLPTFRLSDTEPQLGQALSILGISHPPDGQVDARGMPFGFAVSHHGGRVVAITENYIYLDCEFDPGNSGAPLIEQHTGEVVAVATEVLPAELADQEIGINDRVSRATRVRVIHPLLEKLKTGARRRIDGGGLGWCSVRGLRP